MKTTILTQKKYSISLKDSSTNLDKLIAEIFLLAKTLKEEKDRGLKLSNATINPVDQSIEVMVTADANSQSGGSSPSSSSQPSRPTPPSSSSQSSQSQPQSAPPRPNR